jgi:hypothetical protein
LIEVEIKGVDLLASRAIQGDQVKDEALSGRAWPARDHTVRSPPS